MKTISDRAVVAANTPRSELQRARMRRERVSALVAHSMLAAVGVLFLIPFYWLVVTALKPADQVFSNPLTWWPDPVRWDNFAQVITSPAFPFTRLLSNTLFYTVLSTLGVTLSSALVAYPFARMQFRGKETLFAITLATMMLPSVVTLIPTYILFRTLDWVGGYAPLIVPLWFGSAFNIFLLRQFMLTIPLDLTDAARVDGATDVGIFWRIMLPLIRPALIVVALLHFLYAWNDFFGPLIYVTDADNYPLVVGLYAFLARFSIQWNLLMAASLLISLPILVLFFAAQRYFIEGVTMSGLK
jgi:ABC-type glycerol-3-phosphate transport system permease component